MLAVHNAADHSYPLLIISIRSTWRVVGLEFGYLAQKAEWPQQLPLVLDLIRFTELARRRGETGLLTFLASFFKSPLGVSENDFVRQFQMLEAWTSGVGAER